MTISANRRLSELHLIYRKIVKKSFAPVAKHGFEEASLEGVTEAENTKSIGGDKAPRIAKPAWRLPISERIWMGAPVDPTECPARWYRLDFELCAREIEWR
ncbi:hypothetical protein NKH74_30505 [Mesorhizobium sp. M0933]|uniref:hypothetical protein n=1 Tax=Mesorhizobium sp. M0933 TaxID=2957030 RepID=UPI003337F3D6